MKRKWKWSQSVVSDCATWWTLAHQAPPSMGFSRQEYWSALPFPSPGDLPDPGISCTAGRCLTFWATREALILRSIPLKMSLVQVTLGNEVLNKDKQGVLGLFKPGAALYLWYGHLLWISLGGVGFQEPLLRLLEHTPWGPARGVPTKAGVYTWAQR